MKHLKREWNYNKEISPEQIAKVIVFSLEGLSWSQIARNSGVSNFTVWKYKTLILDNL